MVINSRRIHNTKDNLRNSTNLTHFTLLEESNFSFKYVGLCDFDIPREKWLNYFQTVETDQTDPGLLFLNLPITLLGV